MSSSTPLRASPSTPLRASPSTPLRASPSTPLRASWRSIDESDPVVVLRGLPALGPRSRLPNLTPAFVEASRLSGEPLYKTRDAHWTIRGNRVAADAETRVLADLVCPAGPPAPHSVVR